MTTRYVEARLESNEFDCESLQIHKIVGEETLSQLFHFEVEVVSTAQFKLEDSAVTGASVSIVFLRDGFEIRKIHGMVSEFWQDINAEVDDAHVYRMMVVPRVARMKLVETQEIFLEMTVPEIISQKLESIGFSGADFEMRLSGTYPKRDFVVQYKESDFAFVCRLAEHLGIGFSFDHEGGVDKLVWSDAQDAFPQLPPVTVRPRGERMDVYSLESRSKIIPAVYVVQDYNYRTPQVPLSETSELPDAFGGGVVEYGGHFKTPAEGQILASVRGEERQVERMVFTGESDLPGLSCGRRVMLSGKRMDDVLLLSVKHDAAFPTTIHGASGAEVHYKNSFRAIPVAHTYRPPRTTPRPKIFGLVNAIVEHRIENGTKRFAVLDESGRYTLRFFFDTADHPTKQSKVIRMLQPHAGTNYGMHFPLKPGVEVLVGFVDGDPDRPIIVGSTYRPDTPNPVADWNHSINKLKSESGVFIEFRDY
ncbi:MAG: type VI secretion system tip protein VgrG [Polyangiaceae bacterium]|nr:type VI secretion system tip protein VgrG [Polyangiaceae bacterium]